MASQWDDAARVEQLRALHAEGLSMAQIAKRLGATRNAVIGKCHRIGLFRFDAAISRRTQSAGLNEMRAVHNRDLGIARRAAARAAEVLPPEPVEPPHLTRIAQNPVPFLESRPGQCRAPHKGTGPDMLVCGNPAEPGRSYCKEHHRAYYVPASKKRL